MARVGVRVVTRDLRPTREVEPGRFLDGPEKTEAGKDGKEKKGRR
jgi:hypothetical protein